MITSHPLFRLMKKTIDTISTDNLEKFQVCIGAGKLVTGEPMEDGYVDDLETSGTTYLLEKPEGQPPAYDEFRLGGVKRYLPKTMAKAMSITEEAMEDNK